MHINVIFIKVWVHFQCKLKANMFYDIFWNFDEQSYYKGGSGITVNVKHSLLISVFVQSMYWFIK